MSRTPKTTRGRPLPLAMARALRRLCDLDGVAEIVSLTGISPETLHAAMAERPLAAKADERATAYVALRLRQLGEVPDGAGDNVVEVAAIAWAEAQELELAR